MRVRFGDCLLDSETRHLRVRNVEVRLQPKAYSLLELLVQTRSRVLPKNELHERLWPGTFVSDGTLTSLMAEIRNAVGDDARQPRFVRTVHGFGYAFCGEATEVSGSAAALARQKASCWLIRGRRRYALAEGETIVGRDPGAAVSIADDSVSRRHAIIRVSGDGAIVEDLGNKNGTHVRGERVRAPVPLTNGDAIRFGNVERTFRVFAMPDSTVTGIGDGGPDESA